MNRLSCVMVVIALCIGFSNAKMKNSVHFKNSLLPKNILKIHCLSDEDDLGIHFLNPGQTYNIRFNDSIFKTKIDCQLWQGINYNFFAKFRAYKSGGLIVHHGKMNFWDAREDGIYFTHGKQIPKLEYKWKDISLRKKIKVRPPSLF
ncbi:unnamed protein product [Arabidopsis lyrata]|uniref:S-protein homolog n=1 Tax=Arabidopsis lyrata subsp. lyrata TaxID=81972 RepID=D7KL37_ARALL|nr:S-protein homolog 9 [Arabidopsis lyrata subsp. lyrata]EFH70113.1 hypothetical protein ARALYDRAFT_891144 [Arabidopsis lyrata subsp. lyrata]CAH8254459.1 unnamed protein product [Arabidopsis lyrata]|eukprot:XP_002893854.1 S-protein homolog 9 [Arabidopsis lyrata subsp. lyrata]